MIQGAVLARAWRFEPSLMYQQKQKLRALFLSYDHPLNVLKLSIILSLDHPVSPSELTRRVPLLHSPGRWSHFPDTRHPCARLPRGADAHRCGVARWAGGGALMRFLMTFLVMASCPLSQRDMVRVRGFCPHAVGPLTRIHQVSRQGNL